MLISSKTQKVNDMHAFRKFVSLSILGLVQACGGAGGSSDVQSSRTSLGSPGTQQGSELRFDVEYSLNNSPMFFPAGAIQVSPVPGQMTIGGKEIAKVELLLFGHDKQQLDFPNSQDKYDPQLRYVFKVPESFTQGSYPCGTGTYISEVRVTDVNGSSLAKTFEICPGVPFKTSAP
jgi:hypothetical protein